MTTLQFLLIYLATTTIASAIELGVFLLITGDERWINLADSFYTRLYAPQFTLG